MMPELRQKEKNPEDTVRVDPVRLLEKPELPPQLADKAHDIQELERRGSGPRSDIAQSVARAGPAIGNGLPSSNAQAPRSEPLLSLATPSYFAGLNRFG